MVFGIGKKKKKGESTQTKEPDLVEILKREKEQLEQRLEQAQEEHRQELEEQQRELEERYRGELKKQQTEFDKKYALLEEEKKTAEYELERKLFEVGDYKRKTTAEIEKLRENLEKAEQRCQKFSRIYNRIKERLRKKSKTEKNKPSDTGQQDKKRKKKRKPRTIGNPDVELEVGKIIDNIKVYERTGNGLSAVCKDGREVIITNVGELVIGLSNTTKIEVYQEKEGVFYAKRI